MTNQQHPITPPSELVENWYDAIDNLSTSWKQQLATQAAQWGADQELEALMSRLRSKGFDHMANDLLAARRPKPPSLKEQALSAIGRFTVGAHITADGMNQDFDTIRRALEQLND